MTRLLATVAVASGLTTPVRADDGPHSFVKLVGRDQRVELEKTRGALDLTKPFTIEAWVRWDTGVLDKMMYLAGDEAWPGMSANVPVPAESGWALRTTKVRDADRQGIDFTVAGSARGMRGWFSVVTPLQRVPPGEWQHVAVSRTATDIRIFWNGKPAARRPVEGIALHSSPSNVFVGVRSHAWPDREFVGDVRAFRLSSKARYTVPFEPAMPLAADEAAVAVLDFAKADAARVPDGSGNNRHGLVAGGTVVKPKQ